MDYADKQWLIAYKGLAEDDGDEDCARELKEHYAKALKAAESGDIDDYITLGDCYWYGFGVEEDNLEAAFWYARAAAKGSASAMRCLGWSYQYGYGVLQNTALGEKCYRLQERLEEQGEAMNVKVSAFIIEERCINCALCVTECPHGAVLESGGLVKGVDPSKCTFPNCRSPCREACLEKAIDFRPLIKEGEAEQ